MQVVPVRLMVLKDLQVGFMNKIVANSGKIYALTVVVLCIAVFITAIFAITLGTVDISMTTVIDVVLAKFNPEHYPKKYSEGTLHDVIWLIRMPRVVLACFVGMALAVVGVVMQAVVKNPLADPYILGISSGASLGATLAILLGVGTILGGNFVGIMAFIGAFMVSIGVLMISNIGGKSNSIRLLLAGMALSAVCSSFSSLAIFFAHDRDGIKSITYWLMGSLAGAKWSQISFIAPFILLGVVFFITQYRTLNLMLLGDDVSITLGRNLHNDRRLYLIITSLMMGLVVYCSGMIGFVGLIIPHISRMLFGTDHKKLILISALFGAVFMIFADILSRTLLPHTELPIGILISAIGAPCFIWLLCRKSYGFGNGGS